MNKLSYETYDANRDRIVEAINHYRRVLNNEEIATRKTCPLCQKYNYEMNTDCEGCPIYEVTNEKYCDNTPYKTLYHHTLDQHPATNIRNQCTTCTDLITKEIDFLRSLNPFQSGDQVRMTRQWTEDENHAYITGRICIDEGDTGTIERISDLGNCRINERWYPPVILELISTDKPTKHPAQISYKQVINRGEKEIIVTGFYNILKSDQLPTAYIDIQPHYYKDDDTGIYSSMDGYIDVGHVYSVDGFNNLVSHLCECSKRLHTINKQLQIENANWEGVEKTVDIS